MPASQFYSNAIPRFGSFIRQGMTSSTLQVSKYLSLKTAAQRIQPNPVTGEEEAGETRIYDRGQWKDAKPCRYCQRVRLV